MDGKPEVFYSLTSVTIYFSLLIFCNNFRRLKSRVFGNAYYIVTVGYLNLFFAQLGWGM